MAHEDVFHTKAEIVGCVLTVEGCERHHGGLTPILGPILLDFLNTCSILRNKIEHDNDDGN